MHATSKLCKVLFELPLMTMWSTRKLYLSHTGSEYNLQIYRLQSRESSENLNDTIQIKIPQWTLMMKKFTPKPPQGPRGLPIRHLQVHIWRIIAIIFGLGDKPNIVLSTITFTWKVKLTLVHRSSTFVKLMSVSLRVKRWMKRLLWDKCFDINGDIWDIAA